MEIEFVKTNAYWDDMLAPYKRQNDPTTLIFLLDFPEAIRLTAAWPFVPLCYQMDQSKEILQEFLDSKFEDKNEGAVWKRLWGGTIINTKMLGVMSRLSYDRTVEVLETLQHARLIFPDNTIHDQARKVLSTYIGNRLRTSL